MNVSATKSRDKSVIVLVESPLTSTNINYLDEILRKADGYLYLNAVQQGSLGGNYGIPGDSADKPLNTYLPGGIIIRARYTITDIRERYNKLRGQQ